MPVNLLFLIFLVVKVVVACVFLGYASVLDVRFRRVCNCVWLCFFPLALGLSVFEFLFFGYSGVLFVFGCVLPAGFALACFYIGEFVCGGGFGGADAKCLVCLGVLFPFFPGTQLVGFVLMAFGMGSLVALCVMAYRRKGVHVKIPLLPYIFAGFLILTLGVFLSLLF